MQRLLTFTRVYYYLAVAVLAVDLGFKGSKVMHSHISLGHSGYKVILEQVHTIYCSASN